MSLPPALAAVMIPLQIPLQPLFDKRVFERALILTLGVLLAVRTRTLTAALRVTGREDDSFSAYHRVLSRARWSCREAARVLLGLLVEGFVPEGPLVVGLDETVERRWGAKIEARGIYRAPVRSSHGHFVKASGLRWLSLSVLAEVPWAGRVWALPFLTVLCPSARYYARRGSASGSPKKLTDHARQAVLQLARWLRRIAPERRLVVVTEAGFAAIRLLAAVRERATVVTRLRLDAALYDRAPVRRPGRPGRPRKKGERQPTLAARLADPATAWRRVVVSRWYGRTERVIELATGTALWYHAGMPAVPLRWVLVRDARGAVEPKAFLCTDERATPLEVVSWYVRRWAVEVTCAEVRRHLGVETQRQWSAQAIARTTPCLLGLFSVVALVADALQASGALGTRQCAWYRKEGPSFSDALAAVQEELGRDHSLWMSPGGAGTVEIPRVLLRRLTSTLAYAA